jgi:acyl carrier protein
MTRSPNEERAIAALCELCSVERSSLRDEAELVADLGLDSIVTLDLLMTLEEELDREISEVEAAELVTVGDILAFVRSHDTS